MFLAHTRTAHGSFNYTTRDKPARLPPAKPLAAAPAIERYGSQTAAASRGGACGVRCPRQPRNHQTNQANIFNLIKIEKARGAGAGLSSCALSKCAVRGLACVRLAVFVFCFSGVFVVFASSLLSVVSFFGRSFFVAGPSSLVLLPSGSPAPSPSSWWFVSFRSFLSGRLLWVPCRSRSSAARVLWRFRAARRWVARFCPASRVPRFAAFSLRAFAAWGCRVSVVPVGVGGVVPPCRRWGVSVRSARASLRPRLFGW